MNSITELLNLEDADIFISDISINGTIPPLILIWKIKKYFVAKQIRQVERPACVIYSWFDLRSPYGMPLKNS